MYRENTLCQSIYENDWIDFDILWGDFTTTEIMKAGNLKRQAAFYLGTNNLRYLDRKTIRELVAKKRKLRRHSRKLERSKEHDLIRQVNWYLNYCRDKY
jgi:hypothetical protein